MSWRKPKGPTPIPPGVEIKKCPPAAAHDYEPPVQHPKFGKRFLEPKRPQRKPQPHEVLCDNCKEISTTEDLIDSCCPHCDTAIVEGSASMIAAFERRLGLRED